MASKMRHGDGDDAEVLNANISGTTAIVSDGDDQRDVDSIGAQLINDFATTTVAGAASGDGVVSGTKTWTIAGLTFTGLTGATIRVTGAVNAGNNGDFVISSVTSAHVAVTTTASGLVTESFTAAQRFTLVRTDSPPAGSWKIEVSNDFVPDTNGTIYGQIPASGTWTDITSEFSPSIDAVTTAGSQYAQMDITARALRYTFTPTSGLGTARVIRFSKSWS